MRLTASQLRNIIKEEVALAIRKPARRLSEGHARITEEEFAAWKSGDWGFVSESGEAPAGGPAAAAGGAREKAMQQLSNGMSALTAAQNLFQQIYGSSRGKNTVADLENILVKLDDIYNNEM